ncbi:MAG: type II toxin-antitoxin system prevent-host-death family antitoxin [Deltaproteobacteria bacterium]|nr:type II toxin-antitoxin system prevent-host-death family antitoxin [Deltaproteobacteria bacterium]
MKTAAVSELKARLSKYLSRVKSGEEVLITDRGNPVARLLPISRPRPVRENMASMEKRGLIRLGSGKFPKDFWTLPKAEDSEGLVLRALLEEREGGR